MITIYEAFVKPHLDNGDVLYDQGYNASFHQKLEKIQRNACVSITITGGIRHTSKEKIYQELGLESLESRRWFSKLCFFFKILKNKSPDYLFRIIPQRKTHHTLQGIQTKFIFLKLSITSFLPSTTIECCNIDQDLRNSESYTLLYSSILKFIRPSRNIFYGCQNIIGIKLVTRLCLQSFRKYLELTPVFMWNSALREKCNLYFARVLQTKCWFCEKDWALG